MGFLLLIMEIKQLYDGGFFDRFHLQKNILNLKYLHIQTIYKDPTTNILKAVDLRKSSCNA